MLRCVYTLSAHTNMLAKSTQRHTHRAWLVASISVGLFSMIFPFVNHPVWDITGWLPWDLRSQALRGTSCKQLKTEGGQDCHCPLKRLVAHCSVTHKYTQSWHISFTGVQTCTHMCTWITFSIVCFSSHRYGPSFDSAPYSFPTIPVYSACRHVTVSNVFKIRNDLGLVAYKGRESTNLLADIK